MHLATCRGHVSIFYFSGIHYLHNLENQGRYCHSLYPGYKIWQYVSRRTIALLTLLSSSIFHVPYRRRGKFVDGPSLEVAAARTRPDAALDTWFTLCQCLIHIVSTSQKEVHELSSGSVHYYLTCTHTTKPIIPPKKIVSIDRGGSSFGTQIRLSTCRWLHYRTRKGTPHLLTKFRVRTGNSQGNQVHISNVWFP